jgi:hypothetical protein
MAQQSQKDAVFKAVTGYFADNDIDFVENETVARPLIDKAGRKTIISMLTEATRAGEVSVEGKSKTYDVDSDKEMSEYWGSTLSNWLTRDTRFNKGEKHVADPSKGGSRDPQLKALNALLKQRKEANASDEDIAEIQTYIDTRKAELSASKKKEVVIDIDALPAELQHLAQ